MAPHPIHVPFKLHLDSSEGLSDTRTHDFSVHRCFSIQGSEVSPVGLLLMLLTHLRGRGGSRQTRWPLGRHCIHTDMASGLETRQRRANMSTDDGGEGNPDPTPPTRYRGDTPGAEDAGNRRQRSVADGDEAEPRETKRSRGRRSGAEGDEA